MPVLGRLDKPSYAVIRSLRGGAIGEARLMRNEILGEYFVQKTYNTFGIEDSVGSPALAAGLDIEFAERLMKRPWDPRRDDTRPARG